MIYCLVRLGFIVLAGLVAVQPPHAQAKAPENAKTSPRKPWPGNTSMILRLDGVDRYFFPASTKIDGLKKEAITELLNQGEFAVIQARLKQQPDEIKRYLSCMSFETSSGGRSNPAKRGYSLEVLAALCLASKTSTIDLKGYIHQSRIGSTPEMLLISTSVDGYNSALDIGIPTLNAKIDRNGNYTEDATRRLPDYCGGTFADPRACIKVCEFNPDEPICRSCSRFDSGQIQFVNIKPHSPQLRRLKSWFQSYRQKNGPDLIIAQAYFNADELSRSFRLTGYDISQLRMFSMGPDDSSTVGTCFPCPKGAKIDKFGKCMKDGCDIGKAVAEGTRCRSAAECAPGEILVDGVCEESCAKQCDAKLNDANNNLRGFDLIFESIKKGQAGSISPQYDSAIKKYGIDEVIRYLEIARKELVERKEKVLKDRAACGPKYIERKCEFRWILIENAISDLNVEKECGVGRTLIRGVCADKHCLSCVNYANYYDLPRRQSLGECGQAELGLALRLMQERFRHSFGLLLDQCLGNAQIAQQCDAFRNPTDQDIANLLKGYGITCFPGQGPTSQASPE